MSGPLATAVNLGPDQVLRIEWSDGALLHHPAWHLRCNCPCARCREDATAQEPLTHASVRLRGVKPVGNYALELSFDDGHGLGLYTWQNLRELGFPPDEIPEAPKSPDAFEV